MRGNGRILAEPLISLFYVEYGRTNAIWMFSLCVASQLDGLDVEFWFSLWVANAR